MSRDKHTSDGGSTTYYDIPEGAMDLQDLIEWKNMNFSIGNIFKACYRLGQKSGQDDLYDINKIIFFAQREKVRLEKQLRGNSSEPRWYIHASEICPFGEEIKYFSIRYKTRNNEVYIFTGAGADIAKLKWKHTGDFDDIIEYMV